MKSIVLGEAYRMISVRDGDRTIEMPVIQAIIRGVALSAAKGHHRSQRMFADLLGTIEHELRASYEQYLEMAIEYKVGWEEELERRERLGITGPEPLPHPDDIVVDIRTGTVKVTGPFTKEEKVFWARARTRKQDCHEEIKELEALLRDDPENKFLADELRHEKRIREIICRIIPD